MLLVQHAQQIPMSPSLRPIKFNNSHRRAPSAPVHVQATNVPGLLSLSKPQQQQQANSKGSATNGRYATPRQPRSKPTQQQQEHPASPDAKQQQRGRGSPAKEKATRSSSKTRAGHGRRARQPSPPPLPSSEQVPSPISNFFSSPMDDVSPTPKAPFATLPKASTPTTMPVLSSPPSGRLAKRRNRGVIPFPKVDSPTPANKSKQQQQQNSPSPSPVPATKAAKPISAPLPVPQAKKPTHGSEPHLFSRSDPVKPSHFPRVAHRRVKAGAPSADRDVFPVCDDDSDSDRPSTPSPLRVSKKGGYKGLSSDQSTDSDEVEDLHQLSGSHTAPPSTVRRTFATSTPTPSPQGGARRPVGHKRAPSYHADTMYNLPFESDSEMTSMTSLNFRSVDSDLFGGVGKISGGIRRPRLQSSSRCASTPNGKALAGAFAYASSAFQNSPSPAELPNPIFSLSSKAVDSPAA